VRRGGLVALLYLIIAIGFFADAAIGRGAFFHYDTWMQNYAFRAWWFEQLKDGHFATWCPGMFAGYPLFAETQTGPLYPPTFLLFLALPPTLAFSWSVILHFALAGWGMHVLLRRCGASFASCLLAGLTLRTRDFSSRTWCTSIFSPERRCFLGRSISLPAFSIQPDVVNAFAASTSSG
jgi:hypothetical protein